MIHTVKRGESLSLIALQYQKFGIKNWQEIYEHELNRAFKAQRSANLIQPGDKIHIPLVSIDIKGKKYWGTKDYLEKLIDKVLFKIKQDDLPKCKRKLEHVKFVYRDLSSLRDSDMFICWILASINSEADLAEATNALCQAEFALGDVYSALNGRNIPKVKSSIDVFQKSIDKVNKVLLKTQRALDSTAGNVVLGLEFTKTTSYTIVGCYVGLAGAGQIAAAPSVMASPQAALGFDALFAMIQSGADEGGKAIAGNGGSLNDSVITVLTAGVSSAVVGKVFAHPKAKEYIGKLAFHIAGKITPNQLGIIIKTGTVKDLLEKYMAGAGSESLKTAINDGVKTTNGKMTTAELIEKLEKSPQAGVKNTFLNEFGKWAILSGLAVAKK